MYCCSWQISLETVCLEWNWNFKSIDAFSISVLVCVFFSSWYTYKTYIHVFLFGQEFAIDLHRLIMVKVLFLFVNHYNQDFNISLSLNLMCLNNMWGGLRKSVTCRKFWVWTFLHIWMQERFLNILLFEFWKYLNLGLSYGHLCVWNTRNVEMEKIAFKVCGSNFAFILHSKL